MPSWRTVLFAPMPIWLSSASVHRIPDVRTESVKLLSQRRYAPNTPRDIRASYGPEAWEHPRKAFLLLSSTCHLHLVASHSMASTTTTLLAFALFLVTVLHALTTYRYEIRLRALQPPAPKEYSWLGNNHPDQLPIHIGRVALVWDDPSDWGLLEDDQWGSLFETDGFTKVGPHNRTFQISMMHQLHCLDVIRVGFVTNRTGFAHHIEHCLRYLRQSVLCCADDTLEETHPRLNDAGEWVYAASGTGMVHECKDWTAIRRYMNTYPADECGSPDSFVTSLGRRVCNANFEIADCMGVHHAVCRYAL